MAYTKHLKISDDLEPNQLLEVYINDKNRVFINVGQIENENNSFIYTGYITLSKEDTQALIKELQELEKLL